MSKIKVQKLEVRVERVIGEGIVRKPRNPIGQGPFVGCPDGWIGSRTRCALFTDSIVSEPEEEILEGIELHLEIRGWEEEDAAMEESRGLGKQQGAMGKRKQTESPIRESFRRKSKD